MKAFKTIAALAMVAMLAATALGPAALAQGGPPEVVCVPWTGLSPAVPHDTWSGLEITLKGTAHDPDGDHTLATYEWDFGDGSPVETGTVGDPYAIEVRHTYTGNEGDLFVATLKVTDDTGATGADQYLVAIRDGADLAVQVNVAIDEGLWRLHKDQVRGAFEEGTPYGYWEYGWNSVAATAASTEAFEIQGSLPTGDPAEDPYVETVQRGLNYLLDRLYSLPIAQDPVHCPQGDPDVNGNGYGLLSHGNTMYEGGMALMALSSSLCPDCLAPTVGDPNVSGRSYADIAQDMVDAFAYCQTDPSHGDYRGGWRYNCNSGDSDNSVSQWPVIGMESAEVNLDLTVPQFVKDELSLWIDWIQNDDPDDRNGGSGYTHPSGPNVARTGGLLAEMKFFGDTIAEERVQRAADYINTHWQTDWEHFPANSYYAFYSVMKGFRLLGIKTINPINDPSGFDWYGDPDWGYAQHIVGDQAIDGAWYNGYWAGHPLTSAWAILTLRPTVVQPGPVADAGPGVPSHPPIIEITFNGTGSYHRDPDRNIVQYVWDFGDGSPPVEGPVVKHAFPAVFLPDGSIDWDATTADYVVTLTVYDDNDPALSDSDTTTVHITAPPYPPIANPNGPYSARPCDAVLLDGSGSYDPNGELYPDPEHPWHGELVSWEWDLDNDGEYDDASGETVPWTVCDLGVHVVGLKVTNSFGASDEADTVVKVGAIHDVAVDSVTPSASEVLVGTVVGIEVVVTNLGDYVESFGVALYYDGVKIGGMSVSDLAPGDSPTLSFDWDTTGLPEGCYDIKAVADTIPGEINTANNLRYSDTQVCITYNRPPTADSNGPYYHDEGVELCFDGTGSSDPDGHSLTYDWDFGDGDTGTGPEPCHTYADDDIYNVCLTVTDPFGASDTKCTTADIENVAPEVTANLHNQTVQYGDYICDVTFTATDVEADTMTIAIPDSLPDSLTLTSNGCSVSGGIKTCTWTLAGTMDQPVGRYSPEVFVTDDDGGSGGEDTNITVVHEDADIWLDSDNPVAVEVDSPGGDSPSFSLTAYVKETYPDGATDCGGADPGDINNAEVEMTLAAVGPGGSYTVMCTPVGVTGTGYDAILEVSCDFDGVEVNTYHVQASVAGDYYDGGPDEDVLVVFDPSLGFTTGGGWFYWPGTTEKTNFGYTMKYNKKATKVQGSLLLIRHVAPGEKYRVKSNALYGLSLGEAGEPIYGWASFSGKCTYKDKDWEEPEGNHEFLVYVEDHGEPGKNVDQFWIEVYDKDRNVIPEMSMERPSTDYTEALGGGNIVVPHTPN